MNRVKFPLPQPIPDTPIRGIEVQPVVFQSPAMQKLALAARRQRGSRWAVIKPKRASRAILVAGRPFYWTPKGYYRAGVGDRRPLQVLIWEKIHGRKLPPRHEIFFIDRDRHNFTAENLEALSKEAMHTRIVVIGENKQISPEQRQQMASKRWTRAGKKMTDNFLSRFNAGGSAPLLVDARKKFKRKSKTNSTKPGENHEPPKHWPQGRPTRRPDGPTATRTRVGGAARSE